MIKFFFCLFLLMGLFLSTRCFSQQTKEGKRNHFQYATSAYRIFKFKKSYYWVSKNAKPTTLSHPEIKLLDKLLNLAIKEYNKNISNNMFSIKPLIVYKRQIVPIINNKGEKEVWINCLCDRRDNTWKNQIIIVMDGGNCYFNLKINLTKKTFSQIAVNGYA